MSKLFKLKQWLTLEGAADHLSTVFGEPVSVADLLQLALDGHLKLSVNFVNHANAKYGNIVPIEHAKISVWSDNHKETDKKFPFAIPITTKPCTFGQLPEEIKKKLKEPGYFITTDGINIDIENGKVLELESKIETLEGVWDLLMLGSERLDVEHRFHQETGGPEVTLVYLDGVFVGRPDGQICQLVERLPRQQCNEPYNNPQNFYPAGGLPDDSVLVVRTKALIEFLDGLNDSEAAQETPLTERAETTYLNIIGGLLELMLDPDATERKRFLFGNQSAIIAELLNRYPSRAGMSQRTLEKKFAAAKRSLKQT